LDPAPAAGARTLPQRPGADAHVHAHRYADAHAHAHANPAVPTSGAGGWHAFLHSAAFPVIRRAVTLV
jgi:hypothetical protein